MLEPSIQNFDLEQTIVRLEKVNGRLIDQISFQEFTNTLLTYFLNISLTEVDEGINQVLQEIGEFTRSDSTCFSLFSLEETPTTRLYEWHSKSGGLSLEPENTSLFENFPWLMEQLSLMKTIHTVNVVNLPSDAEMDRKIISQSPSFE